MSPLPDRFLPASGVREPVAGASSAAGGGFGRGGLGRHAGVASAMLAALLVTAGLTTALLALAARDPGRAGRLLAVFPAGWSSEVVLAAAVHAEATPRGQGWWPGLLEVEGGPGLAGRLRAAGAVLVLAPLPFDLAALPGCSVVPRLDPAARRPPAVL